MSRELTIRLPATLSAAMACLWFHAAPAGAACAAASTGAKCLVPPVRPTDAPRSLGPGDVLPEKGVSVLINSEYYGLPPSDGTWRYYRLGREIYRARPGTREVLDRVTQDANRAF